MADNLKPSLTGPNGERLEFIGKGVPRKGDWYMPTWGEYKPVKATGDWGAGVEREILREIPEAVPASGERPAPALAKLEKAVAKFRLNRGWEEGAALDEAMAEVQTLLHPFPEEPMPEELATPGISGEAQPPRIDCDSEEGIAIGLIDSIISCANSLKGRRLNTPAILQALLDMGSNTTFQTLIVKGLLGFDYKKLRRAYETDALERAMEGKGL